MGITAYAYAFMRGQALVGQGGQATVSFQNFLLALFNRTGAGSGNPNVAAGLVVVAGTAFIIAADWNEFTTVPNGGVAQLPALDVGSDCIVFNDAAANALSVAPQAGVQIDTLGIGVGYALAAGKMQWFRAVTPTLIKSMQLG